MYIYHNFFIHLSVNGHLCCFHVLAIVNSAAVNNGIHVSFSVWFPQGMWLGVGLLGLWWFYSYSFFKGLSILFSIVAVSIYIPTNSARGFPLLHTLSSIVVCRFFDDGHSDWCEVISSCSFDLHFFNKEQVELEYKWN